MLCHDADFFSYKEGADVRTSHGEDLLPQGNPATSARHPSVSMIQEWGLLVKPERGFKQGDRNAFVHVEIQQ